MTLMALDDILDPDALEHKLADEENDGKPTGLSSLPGVVWVLYGGGMR